MFNTPNSARLHIAIAGDCNVGKSTLFNKLLTQNAALVSEIPGTTTDVVTKAMEFPKIGPVLLMDTAGLDDISQLGKARVAKTLEALQKADIILLLTSDGNLSPQSSDLHKKLIQNATPHAIIRNDEPVENIRETIISLAPQALEPSLTAHLTQSGDCVLLVMPQDKQAPKKRLILPQQQVIRDLLDNDCVVIETTLEQLPNALKSLALQPKLVITDSQVFKQVRDKLPHNISLTSFSMLLARAKGDIELFMAGAHAIDELNPGDRILIAESCTHLVQDGDVGREKIPKLLQKHIGGELLFDFAVSSDFPKDLSVYKMVIQCGGCMFNRKHMLSRLAKLREAGIPVTNYGVAIAKLQGILHDVVV